MVDWEYGGRLAAMGSVVRGSVVVVVNAFCGERTLWIR